MRLLWGRIGSPSGLWLHRNGYHTGPGHTITTPCVVQASVGQGRNSCFVRNVSEIEQIKMYTIKIYTNKHSNALSSIHS